MDYGILPPEINSARMYSGPGVTSMLSAASAWDDLAAQLYATAVGYHWVTSGLTGGSWQGPSSVSMAAAAAPYVAWLRSTAAEAEQTAIQARAAASAYETAFTATVPPPLITANRGQLMSLIATNVVGQNAPAIAATEAEYGEMWAQDAAAMYGYANSSAAASTVTPFSAPPLTTNTTGLAAQTGAQTASPNAEMVMSTAPQLISTVPNALQELGSPSSSTSSASALSELSKLNALTMPARLAMYPMNFLSRALAFAKTGNVSNAAVAAGAKAAGSGLAGEIKLDAGTSVLAARTAGSGAAVTAGIGQATSVGPLSVPHGWSAGLAGGAPAVPAGAASQTVAATVPAANLSAAPATGLTGVPPLMPITSLAGRTVAGAPSQYDLRPTVIPRTPSAG